MLFEDNVRKWSEICPEDADQLLHIDRSVWTWEITSGEPNLIQTKEGSTVYLNSPHGSRKEAETLWKELHAEESTLIFIYGLGLGAFFGAAKSWLESDPQHILIFYEDDLAVIARFFELPFASHFLSHPQVLLLNPTPSHLELSPYFWNWIQVSYLVTAIPYYGLEKKRTFDILYQRLLTTFHSHDIRAVMNLWKNDVFTHNNYQLLPALQTSYCGESLKGMFSQIPCIIAGAGPSLYAAKDTLRQLTPHVFLFGAGTGMNLLNRYGIEATAGVGLDSSFESAKRIRTNFAYPTPYFYTNLFNAEAFQAIEANTFFIPTHPHRIFLDWIFQELSIPAMKSIEAGRSSTTFSLSLAIMMGCNPIILVGVDLAVDPDSRYGVGYFSKTERTITTENQDKVIRQTTQPHMAELAWLADFATEHPETTFYDCSIKGFGIPGFQKTSLEELEESLKKFKAPLAFPAELFPIDTSRFQQVLQKWKALLEEIQLLLAQNPPPEEEIRQHPVYHYQLYRADEVLLKIVEGEKKLKGTSVTEPERWNHLKRIVEEHLDALLKTPSQPPARSNRLIRSSAGRVYYFPNGQLHLELPPDGVGSVRVYSPDGNVKREETLYRDEQGLISRLEKNPDLAKGEEMLQNIQKLLERS